MATVPNLIIQKIASGATVAGALPLISTATPSLVSQVTKEKRGRIWRYDTLDSGSGGLFESPGRLIEKLTRETEVPTKGIRGEGEARADQLGFTLRRVYFSGAGTTRVQGVIRDPWGTLTNVSAEAVTLTPTPNGNHKSFTDSLTNGTVLPESVVLTFSSGEILKDIAGDSLLRDSTGQVFGTINYETGNIRLFFKTGLATGTTVTVDYKYGSGDVDYEFLDTDDFTAVNPATFTWSAIESGGSELLVPPGWQVRFTSTGNLSVVGSIGILCGSGQHYLPGQQLPGFGVSG